MAASIVFAAVAFLCTPSLQVQMRPQAKGVVVGTFLLEVSKFKAITKKQDKQSHVVDI